MMRAPDRARGCVSAAAVTLLGAVVPVRERAFAVHRVHRLARERDLAPHDHVGLLRLLVEAVVEGEREEDVVGPLFVDANGLFSS